MKLKRKVCAFIISILMVFQLCGGALAQSSYGLDKGCRNSKIEFNLIDRENSIDSDGDWIRIRNIQCFQKFSGELKSKNLSGKDICLKMTSNNYEEKQFILCDINSNKGILYIKKGTNWIKNSNKIVNVPSSSKKIRTRGFNLPSESLLNNIDLEEIIESFSDRVLDTLGLERDDFSKENYNSLMAGIIYAVDQNIMFGAVSFVTGAREDDDNYFFMLGKTSCDIFCIGLFVKSGATLSASAASSFTLGGGLAALGLATSETGLGFIVGEGGAATLATAGTIELLGATTLSFMATRSSDILIKDRQKFAKIERKVVEGMENLSDSIGDKVLKQIKKKWGEKGVEAFKKAADKGIVGAKNQNGIKVLKGGGIKIGGQNYTHEIKVLNKEYGDYRIFGYLDDAGKFVFDQFKKGLH